MALVLAILIDDLRVRLQKEGQVNDFCSILGIHSLSKLHHCSGSLEAELGNIAKRDGSNPGSTR